MNAPRHGGTGLPRRNFIAALAGPAALALARGLPAAAQSAGPAPNILYIMLDDAGYADFADPAVETPSFDRLTAEGTRFDTFYTAPSCGPTRAAVLTGANPLRFGLNHPVFPDSARGIPGDVDTLPEILKAAGYDTAHIGKWHLGTSRPEYLPTGLGFDHTVRYDLDEDGGGNTDFADPAITIDEDPRTTRVIPGHKTEILTGFAVDYLRGRTGAARPFFLNLWYNAPHAPSQPPPRWAARYPNTIQGQHHAFVSHADEQIGRVLDALDATGLAATTIVLLTSDNGASRRWPLSNLPLRDGKRSLFEGGIRLPLLVRWPGVTEPGRTDASTLAVWDLAPTLAEIAGAPPGTLSGDGQSFVAMLRGDRRDVAARPSPLYWAAKLAVPNDNAPDGNEGHAIRDGRWKLVETPGGSHLFDLAADPGETVDLAAVAPDRAAALRAAFRTWKLAATRVAVAALPAADPRLNFHDGDFTAALRFLPPPGSGRPRTILAKPGSWALALDAAGRPVLTVQGVRRAVRLTGPEPLVSGVPHALAFTVYRNIPGRDTVRLYAGPLDRPGPMVPAAESSRPARIAASDAPVEAGETGGIETLSFHLLRLTPAELDLLFG